MTHPALETSLHTQCLVADVGGTNARFALAQWTAAGDSPHLLHAGSRRVSDFESLAEAARHYLQALPATLRPSRAVLAVASPVQGDRIVFTNSRWDFSIETLQRELGLDALHIVNDFAAVAWAVPGLRTDELDPVGDAGTVRTPRGNMAAVVGPGTGLGVAAIEWTPREFRVIASEGGHVGFSPRDDEELYLLRSMMTRYDRVSVERLLCGEGLVNLYRACCSRDAAPWVHATPEQVSLAARSGDAHALAATRVFCAALGSFAGDVALMFGAWQGVYLAGAMLAHVLDEEGRQVFRRRFEDKGRFASILREVPTLRIVRADVGKLGAAMFGVSHFGVSAIGS